MAMGSVIFLISGIYILIRGYWVWSESSSPFRIAFAGWGATAFGLFLISLGLALAGCLGIWALSSDGQLGMHQFDRAPRWLKLIVACEALLAIGSSAAVVVYYYAHYW